jgi:hypothetical protein
MGMSDEARDDSKREQMTIILRFIDKDGFIREIFSYCPCQRYYCINFTKKICDVISCNDLKIENIRGQGYDRGSNMYGEWNVP